MRYVDFEFYQSQNRTLTEEQFNSVIIQAEDMVDIKTARRAECVTGWKLIRVKKAVCALVDMMYSHGVDPTEQQLASVSNNGYSESYVKRTDEENKSALESLLFTMLSGTGLMGYIN